MKLYDILLANTDIKSLYSQEQDYYLEIFKQLITLINNEEVSKYEIEFKEKQTNLDIITSSFNNYKYRIISTLDKWSNDDKWPNEYRLCQGSPLSRIGITKLKNGKLFTNGDIYLNDKLVEEITFTIYNDSHNELAVFTNYNNVCIRKRNIKLSPYNPEHVDIYIDFDINGNKKNYYTQDLNSFLYNIAEEDKKIKVLK